MKIFKTPFATQGDRVAVPDEMQADGSVSYTQGYSQDYEKEYDKAGAKDIERSKMNAIFHDITDAIGKGQSTGIYPWIKEAAPYVKGSFVYYNKEAFYSLVDNNSDTPADGAKWRALSKKQDSLTFTGTGDVVRKSVTDALDGRVTTAQSSADSALQEAQSKQDKLEFVGNGKVMREGAYGVGTTDNRYGYLEGGLDGIHQKESGIYSGTGVGGFNAYYPFIMMRRYSNNISLIGANSTTINFASYALNIGEWEIGYTFTNKNTRTDKNGVLHATTGTPINTLNVSDMSQSVVNRDDITVTSGAVFRADNALSTRITTAQSKADSAHTLAASKTTEAWVKSVSLGIDQNWVNVTGDRAQDVPYVNKSPKAIAVSISGRRPQSAETRAIITVNNVEVGSIGMGSSTALVVVPAGATYKISKEPLEGLIWSELR